MEDRVLPWLLLVAGACEEGLVEPVMVDDDGPVDHSGVPIVPDPEPTVDVLLVIDDGPTMAAAQSRLQGAMQAFAEALVPAEFPIDLHVGVTTGSAAHPACGATRDGRLALPAGCGMAGDFIAMRTDDVDFSVDALADALRCAVAVGTDGCAFQSPLQAIARAEERSRTDGDPQQGFFRNGRATLLVVVGDGFDCSAGPNPDAFDPMGERALWSDPTANAPTPAVCWRAGVRCWVDDAGAIERCESGDLDELGQRVDDPKAATLAPVGALADRIEWLVSTADDLAAARHMVWIMGVPEGFAEGDALSLHDDPDPERQAQFGIGPTCEDAEIAARPPIRQLDALHHLRDSGAARTIGSICSAEYGPWLVDAASDLVQPIAPHCMPFCAADSDAASPGLQPDCRFEYRDPDVGLERLLPTCDPGTPVAPPGCVVVHTDASLDPECAASGWNLQVEVEWTEPTADRAVVVVLCTPSDDRERDCPTLPG